MNQNIAVVVCPLCYRRFVVDVDDIPVVHDRETGAPAPVCPRCAAAIRQLTEAYPS